MGYIGIVLNTVILMFPTTIAECTNWNEFQIKCDRANAQRVAYRLQELCPDARDWFWSVDEMSRHPETEIFTATTTTTVVGDYTALRAYLKSRLRHTKYELSHELLICRRNPSEALV